MDEELKHIEVHVLSLSKMCMCSSDDSRHTHIHSVFVSSTPSTLGTRERQSPLARMPTVLANRPAFSTTFAFASQISCERL